MKTFDEIFIDKTKYGVKVQTSEYGEQGKYIIIDQGQTQIAGYTDCEDGLFKEVPVVIFGDHTRVIKYVDEPFFLGADGVKVLRSKDKNANYKYLFYALMNAKIPNTGYNRHFKWLKEVKIKYPDRERQDEIVEILDKVSDVIQKRQDELSQLDYLIKARFVELFGDPVSDTKKWGQKPLKEMLESIRYGTSTPPEFSESGYAFIRATNIKNGRIVDNDMKYIPQEEADRLAKCKLFGGEILIVRSGVNAGDTCVVTKKYIGQYAGYDMILVLKKELNSVFFNVLVNTSYMDKVVKPLTRRAAQPHLNSEQVQSFLIIQVPIELQNEFADFVHQVDKSKLMEEHRNNFAIKVILLTGLLQGDKIQHMERKYSINKKLPHHNYWQGNEGGDRYDNKL